MTQTGHQGDEDERSLLGLLPEDGSPADSDEIRSRLSLEAERYARACVHLEEQGYVRSGQGRAETICRDLTAIPPEIRLARGKPGSNVTVRRVPITVPHALCDLTGVILSYPGHGGATVPAPGCGVANSQGIQLQVDARTLDVTITVPGLET